MTTSDELVETVARAIWTTPAYGLSGERDYVREWPPKYLDVREEMFAQARAALEASGIERIQEEARKLGGDWFDKAIRDHCDEHGPSGGAWNISMILDRLHRARTALSADMGEDQ